MFVVCLAMWPDNLKKNVNIAIAFDISMWLMSNCMPVQTSFTHLDLSSRAQWYMSKGQKWKLQFSV